MPHTSVTCTLGKVNNNMDVIIPDSQINASTETLYNERRASNTVLMSI